MTSSASLPGAGRTAVVTGASSGIGAATARALAADGFDVVLGARRLDRCQALADEIGARAVRLDVTDDASVAELAAALEACDVLVNNAGGAKGTESVADADLDHWRWMYETNVLGTLRVTRALLDKLLASPTGLVVVIASMAATQPYPGGAGYNAAKFGQRALTDVLRQETGDTPLRVTRIDPGMVETDFSLVRFDGDAEKAAKVYEGVDALTPDDIAECVRWVATRPAHVNIEAMTVYPRQQVSATVLHRHTGD